MQISPNKKIMFDSDWFKCFMLESFLDNAAYNECQCLESVLVNQIEIHISN